MYESCWVMRWRLCVQLLLAVCAYCTSPLAASSSGTSGLGQTEPARKPFSRVSILGERHSGTNYVEMLFKRNVDERLYTVAPEFLDFKHSWQLVNSSTNLEQAKNTLVIVVVRNPYDWAVAMHKCCYHCRVRESQSFEQFISMPWKAQDGMPLVIANETQDFERDVFNGDAVFKDIMQVRAAKYRNFLDVAEKYAGAYEIVRHEDILLPSAAVGWLQTLAHRHSLVYQHDPPQHWSEYKQEQQVVFKPHQAAERSLYLNRKMLRQRTDLQQHVALIRQHLDRGMEARLGYPPIPAF